MPIFSCGCRDCGKEFQTLVRSGETPECPSCASARLEQKLSLVAAPNKGGEDAGAMACGPAGCATGMCPAMAGMAGMGCG